MNQEFWFLSIGMAAPEFIRGRRRKYLHS